MEKRALSPKKKMMWFAAGMIILLILLLYCSAYFSAAPQESQETLNSRMEERLAAALEEMQGVGEVHVVISYASTAESVPAATEQESVFSGETLIVKQNLPEVRGVLIVAEGAEDIRIRTELLYAVTALLDVDPAQVEILY